MAKIIFEKIENEDIFVSDYKNLIKNNEIDFSREGISVIYGPNGTGKNKFGEGFIIRKRNKSKVYLRWK